MGADDGRPDEKAGPSRRTALKRIALAVTAAACATPLFGAEAASAGEEPKKGAEAVPTPDPSRSQLSGKSKPSRYSSYCSVYASTYSSVYSSGHSSGGALPSYVSYYYWSYSSTYGSKYSSSC